MFRVKTVVKKLWSFSGQILKILKDPRGFQRFLNQAILILEDEAKPRILAEDPRGSSSSLVSLALSEW